MMKKKQRKKSNAEIFVDGMFEGIKRERKAWIEGKRCFSCGKYKKPDGMSDWCSKCWREN